MESPEVERNWEHLKMVSSEPSPMVHLLQRPQALRVGTIADPLLQKEAERSVIQDRLTALPACTAEATAWLGLRNLPKTAKEIQDSEEIIRKNLPQLKMLYQTILEIKDHGNHQICAQSTDQDTVNRYEIKEAYASINTTTTTGCVQRASIFPSKGPRSQESVHHKRRLNRVIRNLRYFGTTPSNPDISQTNRGLNPLPKSRSLEEIPVTDTMFKSPQTSSNQGPQVQMCNNMGPQAGMSATQHLCSSLSTFTCTADRKDVRGEKTDQSVVWKERTQLDNGYHLSDIHCTGLSETVTNPGAQTSGGLQEHQDAEEDTADLSSEISHINERGGLWNAIKEFVCTIFEYGILLLRLYFNTVRPVFSVRSSYWRCSSQEDSGWMNLVSICLALPLIFGFSMVLVWSMELTVITLKCMDDDWDCVVDQALAMFRRGLTGVYLDD